MDPLWFWARGKGVRVMSQYDAQQTNGKRGKKGRIG